MKIEVAEYPAEGHVAGGCRPWPTHQGSGGPGGRRGRNGLACDHRVGAGQRTAATQGAGRDPRARLPSQPRRPQPEDQQDADARDHRAGHDDPVFPAGDPRGGNGGPRARVFPHRGQLRRRRRRARRTCSRCCARSAWTAFCWSSPPRRRPLASDRAHLSRRAFALVCLDRIPDRVAVDSVSVEDTDGGGARRGSSAGAGAPAHRDRDRARSR